MIASSLSSQIFSTSFKALPGHTNRKAPPSSCSIFSRRRARRKPSTDTTVTPSMPTSKRDPVWMGRFSLVETAKEVWLIIAFRIPCCTVIE